ncbi:AP-3 complex subunit beta, partial [Ascosphaera acerosa]
MSILLRLVGRAPSEPLVMEALTVIRHLIQQDPAAHRVTVVMLAKHLDATTASPEARAGLVWLVGEHARFDAEEPRRGAIAPDVLRILVRGFARESTLVKQQIVLLGAKVYLQHLLGRTAPPNGDDDDKHPISLLWRYVLLLARYDTSYDLRDRARLYKALLAGPELALAQLLLHAHKPVPHAPSPAEARRDLLLGSATLVVGAQLAGTHGLQGYEPLP